MVFQTALTQISIHALREEGDAQAEREFALWSEFLSTPSARRATPAISVTSFCISYFYPRPPRGGRQASPRPQSQSPPISIHALREEGDLHPDHQGQQQHHFYPRPPRGGRRRGTGERAGRNIFLSTPSARRATACNVVQIQLDKISIHALREEGDRLRHDFFAGSGIFLSTPSARRATLLRFPLLTLHVNFYPRPPRGGRPAKASKAKASKKFLSTPSARRATSEHIEKTETITISIHALREEGDGCDP